MHPPSRATFTTISESLHCSKNWNENATSRKSSPDYNPKQLDNRHVPSLAHTEQLHSTSSPQSAKDVNPNKKSPTAWGFWHSLYSWTHCRPHTTSQRGAQSFRWQTSFFFLDDIETNPPKDAPKYLHSEDLRICENSSIESWTDEDGATQLFQPGVRSQAEGDARRSPAWRNRRGGTVIGTGCGAWVVLP